MTLYTQRRFSHKADFFFSTVFFTWLLMVCMGSGSVLRFVNPTDNIKSCGFIQLMEQRLVNVFSEAQEKVEDSYGNLSVEVLQLLLCFGSKQANWLDFKTFKTLSLGYLFTIVIHSIYPECVPVCVCVLCVCESRYLCLFLFVPISVCVHMFACLYVCLCLWCVCVCSQYNIAVFVCGQILNTYQTGNSLAISLVYVVWNGSVALNGTVASALINQLSAELVGYFLFFPPMIIAERE